MTQFSLNGNRVFWTRFQFSPPRVHHSKHISLTQTQTHSNPPSLLTVSHSHSHFHSLPSQSQSHSLPLSLSLSFFLTPSFYLALFPPRSVSLRCFLPQTLILGGSTGRDSTSITSKDSLSLSLSLFLATDSIKSNICYQNCIFIMNPHPTILKYCFWFLPITCFNCIIYLYAGFEHP